MAQGNQITFRTGSYQDYYDAFMAPGHTGTPVPGCLYYLTELDSSNNVIATHIYLDGEEYGTAGSGGSPQWTPITSE